MSAKISTEDLMKGNKLIAEFMGYTVYPNDAQILSASFHHITKRHVKQYHSDWNELMPVVEKIASLKWRFKIIISYIDSDVFITNGDEKLNIVAFSKPIDAVYTAVTQFITWYNQQT